MDVRLADSLLHLTRSDISRTMVSLTVSIRLKLTESFRNSGQINSLSADFDVDGNRSGDHSGSRIGKGENHDE
ncbi:MAG: hypothetical protein RLZ37_990 [Actinomycetota bacterium]|jgi:hypothetical protein